MSKRQNAKSRRESGTFFALPHQVMDCQNYLRLSYKSIKLLTDLGRQFNGKNNGDLCAAYSIMRKRGWRSKSTLEEALKELNYYGFILLSRQGGRHKASLYALSWLGINECKGKLDIQETIVAPGHWKDEKPSFTPKRKQIKN